MYHMILFEKKIIIISNYHYNIYLTHVLFFENNEIKPSLASQNSL